MFQLDPIKIDDDLGNDSGGDLIDEDELTNNNNNNHLPAGTAGQQELIPNGYEVRFDGDERYFVNVFTGNRMDILLFGSYTRFSCSLIK